MNIREYIDVLLEFIFPRICVGCGTFGTHLCQSCKKSLTPHPEQCVFCHTGSPDYRVCYSCITQHPHLQGVLIGFAYDDAIKQLILDLKFGHRSDVARYLAERLYMLIISHSVLTQAYEDKKLVLTYVPSHRRRRYMVKGYNQSQLLAGHIAKLLDIRCLDLAHKRKHTKSQTKLSRQQRLENLIGVFAGRESADICGDETILIVDDITTTGSTLSYTAQSIHQLYPDTRIWGCVVGRNR